MMFSKSNRSSARKRNDSRKTHTATVTVITSTSSSKKQHSISPSSQEARREWKSYPWESSPKTGYTYADSGSYKRDRLDSPYTMPNMSRVGLGRRSPGAYSREEGYTRSQESISEMSFSSNASSLHSREEREGSYFSPSTTRKGTEYGPHGLVITSSRRSESRSGSVQADKNTRQRNVATARLDPDQAGYYHNQSYKEYEKQLEYSGAPSPLKESSITHLYGLDHSEDEVSEAEESFQESEGREPAMTVVTSILTYMFTSIITIVTTVVTSSVHTVTSFISQVKGTSSEGQGSTGTSSMGKVSTHTEAHVSSTGSQRAAASSSQTSVNSEASHASAGIISKSSSSTTLATVASSVVSSFSSLFSLISFVVTTVVSTTVSILTYPVRAASYLLSSGAASGASWLGARIYHLVSWTTLTDAWLLSRVYESRRRGCCCCLLPLLLLLPLLIPGSHYLYEHGSSAWLQAGLLSGQKQETLVPLPATNDTTVILQHIQNIMLLLNEQRQESHKYLSREEVEAVVRGMVDPQFSEQGTKWRQQQQQNEDLLARLARIKELNVLLLEIQQKHDELSAELLKTKTTVQQSRDAGDKDQSASLVAIQELQVQLGKLQSQLEELQQAHQAELASMKDCCQGKDHMLALIKDQVHAGMAGFVSSDHLKERLDMLQTQIEKNVAALKIQIDSRPVAAGSVSTKDIAGIDASQVDALIAAQLTKYDTKLSELRQSLDDTIAKQTPEWDKKLEAFAENYNAQLLSIQKLFDTKLTDLKSQMHEEVVDQMKLSDDQWLNKLEAVRREMADLKAYVDSRFEEMKSSVDVMITSKDSAQDDKFKTLVTGYDEKIGILQTNLEKTVSDLNAQIDSKLGDFQSQSDKEKEERVVLLSSELDKVKAETGTLLAQLRSDFDSRVQGKSTEDEKKILAQIESLEKELSALQAKMEERSATSDKAFEEKLVLFKQKLDSELGERLSEFEKRLVAYMNDLDQKFVHLDESVRQEIKQQVLMAVTNTYKNYTINEQRQTVVVAPSIVQGGFSENDVKQLIDEALRKFGADKTGMVDFALESSGGSVIGTRCTETYRRSTALMSLLGIPLFYMNNTPRTVIQPDMQPGQCWAFKGDQGFLVIQLSDVVQPTKFTLEHIPRSLSPDGQIKSAPKDFSVWGLSDEHDTTGVHLGNYTYDAEGDSLQTFDSQAEDKTAAYRIVELRIHSNHGNQEYTCLYRFRVHGNLYHA